MRGPELLQTGLFTGRVRTDSALCCDTMLVTISCAKQLIAEQQRCVFASDFTKGVIYLLDDQNCPSQNLEDFIIIYFCYFSNPLWQRWPLALKSSLAHPIWLRLFIFVRNFTYNWVYSRESLVGDLTQHAVAFMLQIQDSILLILFISKFFFFGLALEYIVRLESLLNRSSIAKILFDQYRKALTVSIYLPSFQYYRLYLNKLQRPPKLLRYAITYHITWNRRPAHWGWKLFALWKLKESVLGSFRMHNGYVLRLLPKGHGICCAC